VLIRITRGKDLYYPGELISVEEATAQEWFAQGLAEPATCPDCGSQLEDAGCRVYCPDCGLRKWKD
jgi:uncharacterized Zn finger protein (UPF0148 family)